MILDLILDLLPPPNPEESNKNQISKECINCKNLSSKNVSEGVNVYPCTICCQIGMSEDIDKWEPIETKKMKTSKIMSETNLWRIISFSTVLICSAFMFWGENEPSKIDVIIVMVGLFYLGYFCRRPHPDEKPLIIWLKICILKVQIWNKQAYLYFYPDLKKYRGNPKRKEKVWDKRDRLKKLKRELKELI